jgi:molybdopterin-guanine dinucleotide biosynthesis protein A
MIQVESMEQAGYVLVGGRSSRMGRDKALLPFRGKTLAEHVAGAVAEAAGSVTLVGDPEEYGFLGLPVIPDRLQGAGPLAGIQAALQASEAGWNLVVACDMPGINAEFLARLLDAAKSQNSDCLLPAGRSDLPEPLCAVYHRRCLPVISAALARRVHKVTDALSGLDVRMWPVNTAQWLANMNTPQEWDRFLNG